MSTVDYVIIVDREDAAAKSFAVAMRALDADGAEIEPTGPGWYFSSSLGAFCQYSEPGDGRAISTRNPWESDASAIAFSIEIIAWRNESGESPNIVGLGLCESRAGVPAEWAVLSPKEDAKR